VASKASVLVQSCSAELIVSTTYTWKIVLQVKLRSYRFARRQLTAFAALFRTGANGYRATMPKSARVSIIRSDVKPVLWTRTPRVPPVHATARNTKATLLWIDDFQVGLEMYRAMFERLGYRVLTASSGEMGIQMAASHQVDLVVTDYEMPGMNGEAVAFALKALKPNVPVILFSGSTTLSDRALHLVDACCDKAGSREELLAAIHFLLQKKRPAFLQPPPVAPASDHRTVA
jgi:CheY-like chemotaxis protein